MRDVRDGGRENVRQKREAARLVESVAKSLGDPKVRRQVSLDEYNTILRMAGKAARAKHRRS
jgi:hypothetical protein